MMFFKWFALSIFVHCNGVVVATKPNILTLIIDGKNVFDFEILGLTCVSKTFVLKEDLV